MMYYLDSDRRKWKGGMPSGGFPAGQHFRVASAIYAEHLFAGNIGRNSGLSVSTVAR
jgi:hypothetical protein